MEHRARASTCMNESYGLQFKGSGTLHGVEGHLQHGALLFFQHEPLAVLGLRKPGGFLVSCQTCSHDPEDPYRLERVVERRLRRESADYRNVPPGWPSCVLSFGMRIVRLCSPSPAWRLMCETARQEKWQVRLDGEAECWLKAR